MDRLICAAAFWGALLAGAVQTAAADIEIPPGASLTLGGGSIANAGSVFIGGTLDAGSGSISLAGDWALDGSFLPGTSTVSFFDGGIAQSTLSGDSSFHKLSLMSSNGKIFQIESDRIIAVESDLTIRGVAGAPLQVASPDLIRVAFVDLAASGTQDIEFVGVSNVHAIGQPLAPDQTNQGGSGNDPGWFGSTAGQALPIPTLSTVAMLIFAMLMIATAARRVLR